MRIPMRPYERWLWGGSLLLAVLTRQMALGLVPLALAHGQWQRRQLEQQLTHQWNQQWQVQQQQVFRHVQQQLQSVQATVAALRANLPKTVTDPRVAEISAEVGSLAEQVKQLQEQPRSYLSIRQQMAPLTQRLRLIQEDLLGLKLRALPQLAEAQQQLQTQLDSLQNQLLEKPQEKAEPVPPLRRSVGVFIDGANLYASARDLGLCLDYQQLMTHLLDRKTPAEIHFYSGWDPQNPRQKAFHQYLSGQLGFHLHLKPVTHFANGGSKANLDGELIVDMLRGGYERVMLLSGDGDFLPALRHLQEQGILVEVAAFLPDTHHRLRQFSFTDLSQLLAPGQKVISLPAKQVAPARISQEG